MPYSAATQPDGNITENHLACEFSDCFSGVCHGTLGELIQTPILQNNQIEIAIISLPVQKFSWAYFVPGLQDIDADKMADRSKCQKAIDLYLQKFNQNLPNGNWIFSSELVRGRGMASSTADMVATLRCLDSLFGRQSSPEEIADILRPIERSDSVFLDSYALYISSLQKPLKILPKHFAFHVYYIDEGKMVDTEGVTPRLLSHYQANFDHYNNNLSEMLSAFDRNDPYGIALSATQSAIMGHDAVPKKNMDAFLKNQQRLGADGIVIAHTGSLIGYLFIQKPTPVHAGALSAFFKQLGFQCRYEKAQF